MTRRALISLIAKELRDVAGRRAFFRQAVNSIRYALSPRAEVLRYKPVRLSVASTDRCNLRCDFCHAHSARMGAFAFNHKACQDMTFQLFKDFVDRFREARSISIVGSGEPSMNRELFDMIEYAATRRMSVSTISNGLVPPDFMRRVAHAPLASICISVNGYDEASFAQTTRMPAATFGKVLGSIRELINHRRARGGGPRVHLSFVVDRKSYGAIPKMIALGEELGVDGVDFPHFLPAPFDGFRAEDRTIFAENREAAAFLSEIARAPHRVRVGLPPLMTLKQQRICSNPFTVLRVDGQGSIGGCPIMLLDLRGNGRYDDPDVWNNEYFRTLRRRFIAGDRAGLMEPCQFCTQSCGVPVPSSVPQAEEDDESGVS